MKRTLIPVLILLLLLAGCRQKPTMPKTTAAAWEVYQHYADREDITVAFIGDFAADSCTFDLVMFQVSDSASFVQLRRHFGLLWTHSLGEWDASTTGLSDSVILTHGHVLDSIERAKSQGKSIKKNNNTINNSPAPQSRNNDKYALSLIRDNVSVDRPGHDYLHQIRCKYSPMYYGILTDFEEQRLWLYFFDTRERFNCITRGMFGCEDIISKKYGE